MFLATSLGVEWAISKPQQLYSICWDKEVNVGLCQPGHILTFPEHQWVALQVDPGSELDLDLGLDPHLGLDLDPDLEHLGLGLDPDLEHLDRL